MRAWRSSYSATASVIFNLSGEGIDNDFSKAVVVIYLLSTIRRPFSITNFKGSCSATSGERLSITTVITSPGADVSI